MITESKLMVNKPALYAVLVLIVFLSFPQQLTAQKSKADSVAKARSIIIEKLISRGVTIYDYGQTNMELSFSQIVTPKGNLYFSEVTLKTPDGEETIYLSLDKTRAFLKQLYGIYQIDGLKDYSNVWREQKIYFFTTNHGSDIIHFHLRAAENNAPEESSAYGRINQLDFTINNFKQNRKRTARAISSLIEVVTEKNDDLVAKSLDDAIGLAGYKIDYQPFYDSGLEVYKSGIHQTKSLTVISDQKIKREPRKILISEYTEQFDSYTIAYDDALNFYAVEDISIDSFISEIVGLIKGHNGDGVLDLKIFTQGETIYSTFSIVREGFNTEQQRGSES